MRSWLLSALIAGILLLLACALILLIHPSLITGHFYEMEIKSIEFGPRGQVDLAYDDRIAYGTSVYWDVPPDFGQKRFSDSWSRRSIGHSRRPIVNRHEAFRFFVGTPEERESGKVPPEEFRGRMLVRPGVYRIVAGESLRLYLYESPDGKWIEGKITALTENQ